MAAPLVARYQVTCRMQQVQTILPFTGWSVWRWRQVCG
jgi:hypothetical protein